MSPSLSQTEFGLRSRTVSSIFSKNVNRHISRGHVQIGHLCHKACRRFCTMQASCYTHSGQLLIQREKFIVFSALCFCFSYCLLLL